MKIHLFYTAVIGALLGLLSGGCEQKPVARPVAVEASASGYQVEELFTKNGCTVYRFEDEHSSRPVYFSDCTGQVTSSYRTGGKHKRTVEQQTLTRARLDTLDLITPEELEKHKAAVNRLHLLELAGIE